MRTSLSKQLFLRVYGLHGWLGDVYNVYGMCFKLQKQTLPQVIGNCTVNN